MMNNKRVKYNFRSVVARQDLGLIESISRPESVLDSLMKEEEEAERREQEIREHAKRLESLEKENIRKRKMQADMKTMKNRRVCDDDDDAIEN
jgi:hypothetical protein